MSTVQPSPTMSATTWQSAQDNAVAPAAGRHEPPDHLQITAAVLQAFRRNGWTIAEQRSAGWLYLIFRGHDQAVVYKLVGPVFDTRSSRYQGYRIA